MNEVRKVRGDAKLERLSVEQQEQLLVWLDDENRTYLEVVRLVQATFGLSVGKSAVADYWRRHVMPQRCREEADIAAELAALSEGKFVEAMLNLARRQAWSALAQPTPDVRKAAAMMSLVHRAERADLARRRMALAERRAAVTKKSAAPVHAEHEQSPSSDEAGTVVHPHLPQNPPLFPGSAAVGGDAPDDESIDAPLSDTGNRELHAVSEKEDEPGVQKTVLYVETSESDTPAASASLAALPEPWQPMLEHREYKKAS